MVLVDHTGWKLRRRQWKGTTEQLIEELESTYDNAPNMFSIRIHHGRKSLSYPGRMYVSGRVDIFDMVDIDLFTVVAPNKMVLKLGYTGESEPMFYNYLGPLTSLDVGLYALACEEDVRCLAILVRSFKLIEVYIEHGVTVLDSYLRAPRFRATLKDITDEPAGSIAANRTKKTLLLTWHESSETTKEPVCDSVTPSSLPQHDSSTPCKDSVCESITPRCMPDCILTPPTDESVIIYTQLSGAHGVDTQSHVLPTIQSQFSDIDLSFVSQQATASRIIDDVMRQLSFDETELDGEAGFVDVVRSGVDSSGTEAPIVEEVGTQEFSVEDVVIEDYVSSGEYEEDAEQGNGQEDESAPTDGQFFYDDEGIDTEYDVQSSKDAGTDDDVDEDFLVDEENEIVEPDVDVHLFGISMDLPFDNIGILNLVSDDVLEGEDVDVINANGFDSDLGNDEEINYRKIRLAELRTEMKGVINASGQWKYSFYIGQKFTSPKEAKDRVYLHSIESRRNLKLYKNDIVMIRASCEGKVHVFTMSQGTGPTGPYNGMEVGPSGSSGPTNRSKKRKNTGTNDDSQEYPSFLDAHDKGDLCPWVLVNLDIPVKAVQDQIQCELEVQISMSKAFRAKAKAKREIRGDHVLQYSMLRDYVVELQSTNPNTIVKIAVERNTDPSLPTRVFQRIYVCLGALKLGFKAYGIDLLGLDVAFMKGLFSGQVLCLGDDIDLHLNSNFTFISDRQKVGRPKKKRKRSKHEDEPFVKDGKLSMKGRTITCQSCGNIGHNKATCKGQGRKATKGGNNTEGIGSASRQAQQTKPAVGQDGSCGVIGLSAAAGKGGAGDPGGASVASQAISDNGKFLMVDEEEVTSNKLAPMAEEMIMLIKVLKRNCISPSNSHPPVVITKNMSAGIDNRKFLMVDEKDLIFKKISPMAEEILEMFRVCVAKKGE
nr:hypothetical protein [Tanacetum cinerariifolium]